jgi:hypothetical protein
MGSLVQLNPVLNVDIYEGTSSYLSLQGHKMIQINLMIKKEMV